MNIDILNAYCGYELVSYPRLAQGRLIQPQTLVCIGSTLLQDGAASSLGRASLGCPQLLGLVPGLPAYNGSSSEASSERLL